MCKRAMMPSTVPATLAPWQNCTWSIPGRPEQISTVRALLADFLDGYPAADDAVLLISELAANACAHSASGQPGGTFTVRAHLCGSYLHAEIEDQGSAWDGSLGPAEAPHGLCLLRALSAACGTLPGTQGWITWFTLTPAHPARRSLRFIAADTLTAGKSRPGPPARGPARKTLMPMTLDGNVTKAGTDDSRPATMRAVADKLRDNGIDVQLPDPGEGPCLTVMNANKARSDLTVDDSGDVLWEYWPLSEGSTDPADVTAVALAVLGGSLSGPPPSASPALTLKGAVGQALQARGMKVTMAVYQDGQAFDVAADIIAVNPALPECGQVHVTDDGYITWEYHHYDDSPSQCALAVTDTIVPVLIHGINRSWPHQRASHDEGDRS